MRIVRAGIPGSGTTTAFDETTGSFQPPSVQEGFHAVVVTEPTV